MTAWGHAALRVAITGILVAAGCDEDGSRDAGLGDFESGSFFAFLEGVGTAGEDGTLELGLPVAEGQLVEAAVPVTGTLKLLGTATVVELQGAFDGTAAPHFTLAAQAGTYQIEGVVEHGELAGGYSGPGGSGSLLAVSNCESRMLGDWTWSGTVSVDCEVQGFSGVTSGGFVRYTLEGGVLGASFVSLADQEACPFGSVPGTCSGDSYEETHDDVGGFSDCTTHQVSSLRITFGESTFEGVYSETVTTSGTECELEDSCTFTQVLSGERTTAFPSCEAAPSQAPSASFRDALGPLVRRLR